MAQKNRYYVECQLSVSRSELNAWCHLICTQRDCPRAQAAPILPLPSPLSLTSLGNIQTKQMLAHGTIKLEPYPLSTSAGIVLEGKPHRHLQPIQELALDLVVSVSNTPISNFWEVFDVSWWIICLQRFGVEGQVWGTPKSSVFTTTHTAFLILPSQEPHQAEILLFLSAVVRSRSLQPPRRAMSWVLDGAIRLISSFSQNPIQKGFIGSSLCPGPYMNSHKLIQNNSFKNSPFCADRYHPQIFLGARTFSPRLPCHLGGSVKLAKSAKWFWLEKWMSCLPAGIWTSS